MSFLESSGLYVLLAGLLVILAYALRMPRRRRIFPSVIVLRAMEKFEKRERRKLRTVLSFVLILLCFLMIGFDSGRPFYSPMKEKQRDHILVLDASASMKAWAEAPKEKRPSSPPETRFARAVKVAREIVANLPVGDRMMIVTLSTRARIACNFEQDLKLLQQSLGKIRCEDTSTNWPDAARLVREVLPTAKAPVCHIVSDGAGFDSASWDNMPDAAEWRYHSICKPVGNIAITNFRARTTFHSDNDFEIVTQVRNYSNEPVEVDLALYLDDVAIDAHPLKLGPNAARTEVFQKTLQVGGVLSGRFMVRDDLYHDALDTDNAAYDVVPSPTRPKVLIYTKEKSGFLQAALSANSNVIAYKQDPEKYAPNYAADIVIFYNVVGLPEKLPDKHLIFINTRGKNMPVEVQEEFKNPVMRTWNRHHPLMNYLTLSNLLMAKAQGFRTPGWAETLAETASGPLIIAGETPERKTVFIGLSPRDSDLPFRAALPMLVANAVLWMKDPVPDPEPIRPGETYRIRLRAREASTLELTTPDGKKSVASVPPDGLLPVLDTEQVGVYRYQAGEESGAFSVNLADPAESDLAPAEALKIGEKTVAAREEKDFAKVWRFWPALAVLAFLTVLIENSLYHRRIIF